MRYRLGICHKWHFCKIFLISGKIFTNYVNLPKSGFLVHKITVVTFYMSSNLQKDWQIVENRWVRHPTFSIVCQKCRNLFVFFRLFGTCEIYSTISTFCFIEVDRRIIRVPHETSVKRVQIPLLRTCSKVELTKQNSRDNSIV